MIYLVRCCCTFTTLRNALYQYSNLSVCFALLPFLFRFYGYAPVRCYYDISTLSVVQCVFEVHASTFTLTLTYPALVWLYNGGTTQLGACSQPGFIENAFRHASYRYTSLRRCIVCLMGRSGWYDSDFGCRYKSGSRTNAHRILRHGVPVVRGTGIVHSI